MGRPRNHVPTAPGRHRTHRHHCGLRRIDFAAHHRLQVLNDGGGNDRRINATVRLRAVTALTDDVDREFVAGGHAGTGVNRHLSRVRIAPHMKPEASGNAFERALLHHGLCALRRFFSRLEADAHRPVNLIPEFSEHFRRRKHHGDVAVMPAGMHHAVILARKGKPRVFRNRQRVNIGTDHEGLPREFPLHIAHDAGFKAAVTPLKPHLRQFFPNALTRFVFLRAHFGVGMKITTHFDDVAFRVLRGFFHFINHFSILHVKTAPSGGRGLKGLKSPTAGG